MMTHLISLTVLALLCGFAWHNQSARQASGRSAQSEKEQFEVGR
jgi:hypothetical protein